MERAGPLWVCQECRGDRQTVVQTGIDKRQRRQGRAIFSSSQLLEKALLISTTDKGFTGNRTWNESPATIEKASDGRWQIRAQLSAGTSAWFIKAHSGKLTVSTGFQEGK